MVKAAITTSWPASLPADSIFGIFTNNEETKLTVDASSGALTFTVANTGTIEAGMFCALRGEAGFEVVLVTAVDSVNKTITVTRGQDGTVPVQHTKDEKLKIGVIPAKSLNQFREELQAVMTSLGAGTFVAANADRVLFLNASGTITTDADFKYISDQLRLAGQGLNTGLLLGTDALWYRGAADRMDLASGDSLNIVLGNLQMGAVTVFESDRDVAITLLPNADASLDLGSSSRRWDQIIGNNHEVYNALGDTQPLYRLSNGGLRAGPGGGTTPQTAWARVSDSVWEAIGLVAGDVRLGMSGVGNAFISLRADAAHAQPYALLDNTGLSMGPGGATAPRVRLFEGAANRWDMAASAGLNLVDGGLLIGTTQVFEADRDLAISVIPNATATLDLGSATRVWNNLHVRTINIDNQGAGADPVLSANDAGQQLSLTGTLDISGAFEIGGTPVFEADRDLAITLLPNADNVLNIGSSSRRFANIIGTSFLVYNAASDANPRVLIDTNGIKFGAGGATAVDAIVKRSGVSALQLRDGTDAAYASLDLLSLYVGGTQVFEADRDVAVTLLPNANGTLDLGSGARQWANLYLSLTTNGVLFMNGGHVEVNQTAQQALTWDRVNFRLGIGTTTPGADLDVRKTVAGVLNARVFNDQAAGDSGTAQLTLGIAASAGGDVVLVYDYGAASVWTAGVDNSASSIYAVSFSATGRPGSNDRFTITTAGLVTIVSGDLNVALGALQIAGTTVLENDRDLAITLLPNADNSLNLGSTSRHFAKGYFKDDVVVATSTKGIVLYDGAAYWRITVGTDGSLTTTSLGASEP